MSILVWFKKKLHFWNESKKLDWMDTTNVQNLRKIQTRMYSKFLLLPSLLWAEFRSHCEEISKSLTKAKICTMFAYEFFLKFWTFYWFIRQVWFIMQKRLVRGRSFLVELNLKRACSWIMSCDNVKPTLLKSSKLEAN